MHHALKRRPYILEVFAAGEWHVAARYATAAEAERVIQSLPEIKWRIVQISVDTQQAAE